MGNCFDILTIFMCENQAITYQMILTITILPSEIEIQIKIFQSRDTNRNISQRSKR